MQFETFNQAAENVQCLEIDEKKRWKDPEAIDLIKQLAGVKNLSDVQQLDKLKRNEVLRSCKSEEKKGNQTGRKQKPGNPAWIGTGARLNLTSITAARLLLR